MTWQLLDVLSLAAAHLDSRLASRPSTDMQEEGRFFNFNDNVTPTLAAYSWHYLGILWLYAGITIAGAIAPLYKYIPEEELLYPDYEFEEEEEVEETPATGDGQNYYDYDYNSERNDKSSYQRPTETSQHKDYEHQDYSSTSSTSDAGHTNGYPPPNYYGIQYYPPPRN